MGGPNVFFRELESELKLEYRTIETKTVGGLKVSKVAFDGDTNFHKSSPYVFLTSDVYLKPWENTDGKEIQQMRFRGDSNTAILDVDFDEHRVNGKVVFEEGTPHVHVVDVIPYYDEKKKKFRTRMTREEPFLLTREIYNRYKKVFDKYKPGIERYIK